MTQAIGEKLVCVYSRGTGHTIGEDARAVYARTSTDGGETWTAETVVANTPGYGDVAVGALGDRDDLAILAGAIAGGAEVFVTGDKAVQALHRVGEMQVLSPRQFWQRLVDQQPAGADPAGRGTPQP